MKTYRVPLKDWRKNYYSGKAPALQTLKRRIRSGKIPGTNETGDYVVYCDANYNPQIPEWERNQPPKTGNSIADGILQRMSAAG